MHMRLCSEDKGCDTLEPGPSVPSVGMSFTLRAWWRGWNTGEGNVPSDRRLCLTVTLFYNFVFFLLPSPRNALSYRLYSLCPPRYPFVSMMKWSTCGLVCSIFSKCDVKQGCNLKISSDLRTACPDTWAVHWLRWRRLSAVRERGCLKRLQGVAVPACQVCGRCCDQSVFIIAVWPFPRQSHDWLSRPEEDGLSLVPLAFCLALVSTFFSLFCSNHYFMGSYCNRIYYSHNIILWCIFIFIYLYSVRPFG